MLFSGMAQTPEHAPILQLPRLQEPLVVDFNLRRRNPRTHGANQFNTLS